MSTNCHSSGIAGYLTETQHNVCTVHDPGGLPFTGLDVGLAVAVGLALVVAGFAMRWATQAPARG